MLSIKNGAIRLLLAITLVAATATAFASTPLASFEKLYSAMQWRLVGPFLGGRVEAVAGVPGDPTTYYLGAVVGGVWKTADGGHSWQPIFDRQSIASIGAIAVAPSNPNIIYVGTGEPDPRGDISFGNGVYKSTDGGRTWQHLGLADTRHIGRILINPKNPDIVLVAALGHVYGPNTQRGVFRSTDGGKTWTKVLYKNENTGAIDLADDPHNPSVVYAALWQVRRKPWTLINGGPGSGLYRSTDGGRTWTHLTGHGLPKGLLGRISVSVSGADGNRVYALINADKSGLYRSDDGGKTWRLINASQKLRQRPWYYFQVRADPQDKDGVYVLNFKFNHSTDGGETFSQIATPHVDNHALWIDPGNPKRMIEGNDGGATITVNGGETWTTERNQPTGQFYHVATDSRFPYYLYGAQQDRGTVAIVNASRFDGIGPRDWYPVAGGESGYVLPTPGDPNIVYAGSYFGDLTRYNRRTGQIQDVTPWPENTEGEAAAGLKYRFSWTSPLAFSPQDPNVLYAGAQYVLKTTDGGRSWQRISPDLTRNDKSKQQLSGGPITKDNVGAEYYDVVYTIAPSPVTQGVIWAGTDDGLVQLTRDGGKTWHNVTPKGLPKWIEISLIDASHFDAGTAYLAANAHKRDDMRPYIYRTHDYGKTWTKITDGIKAPAYAHVVREDPNHKGLLFAGTETGVYASFDDGGQWQPLQLNLPITSVRDFAIKNGDLIAATHGRGFWILDDISPLEQIQNNMKSQPVVLFAPAPAVRTSLSGYSRPQTGENPPSGAIIDYVLNKKPAGEVTLKIIKGQNTVIRTYSSDAKHKHNRLPAKPGAHRIVWNLRYAGPVPIRSATPVFEQGEPTAPEAVPGQYTVELTVAGHTYRQPLTVKLDPRLDVPRHALEAQLNLMLKLRDALSRDHRAFNRIQALRGRLRDLQQHLTNQSDAEQLVKAVSALEAKTADIAVQLFQYHAKAPKTLFMNHPGHLNMKLVSLENSVSRAIAAPTEQQQAVYRKLRTELNQQLSRWQTIKTHKLPAINRLLQKK